MVTLAAMLGHSRIQMVLRYAHPTEEHQFQAMSKLESYTAEAELASVVMWRRVFTQSIQDPGLLVTRFSQVARVLLRNCAVDGHRITEESQWLMKNILRDCEAGIGIGTLGGWLNPRSGPI